MRTELEEESDGEHTRLMALKALRMEPMTPQGLRSIGHNYLNRFVRSMY
jgi:hypothetical protein